MNETVFKASIKKTRAALTKYFRQSLESEAIAIMFWNHINQLVKDYVLCIQCHTSITGFKEPP